jgi:hypothetical protein
MNPEQAAQLLHTVTVYKQEKQRIVALQLQLGDIGREMTTLGHALTTFHLGHSISVTPQAVVVGSLDLAAATSSEQVLKRSSFDIDRVARLVVELRSAERENAMRHTRLDEAGLLQVE